MNNRKKPATRQELFDRKLSNRREVASMSVEEKIKRLVKLQRLNAEIAKAAGREFQKPWEIEISLDKETLAQ